MRSWGRFLLAAGLLLVAASGWVLLSERTNRFAVLNPTVVVERLIPTAAPNPTQTRTTPSPPADPTPVQARPMPADSPPATVTTAPASPSPSLPPALPAATPTPTATAVVVHATATARPSLYRTRDRFAVGLPIPPPDSYQDFETLGMGWYLDWQTHLHPSRPGGIAYAQMVRLKGENFWPNDNDLQAIARANPGSLWLVGNEPDVIWQDNATPEQYAAVYYRVYHTLKAADPTAQVAIGGITQPSPLRLQYLDAVLAAYAQQYGTDIPVDVWNIHNFILREEKGSWGVDIPPGIAVKSGRLYEVADSGDMKLFRQQIYEFRRWMKAHGLRNKPLIVSEYGIPMPEDYGYPFERVRDFMYATFDFFSTETDPALGYPPDGNRLVQRWCWYSLGDLTYPTGNLYDPATRKLTPLGEAFRSYLSKK